MEACPQCGIESPDGLRFCGSCGAPLDAGNAIPRRTRKVVTALFCDVVGSTALGEELDPEVLSGVLNGYFEEMRSTIERHGGTVEKFIGDAVMAVFGIPRAHEDDALRAVRAAAEIRDRLPAIAREVGVTLRFRTGVNTGPVLAAGENLAIGDAVNVAARLEQAAAPGEIVLGAETLRLVRDAVEIERLRPLELKGKSERVQAFRLLKLDPSAPGVARRHDAPLVGRDRELRLLSEAWERVVSESDCQLFTLIGEAGVGKSRLAAELFTEIEERATILRGRCLSYGEGITFWPLVEALTPQGEQSQPVVDRLAGEGAAVPEELFWEVRKLLESLAAQRPVVFYVDDLQWAEPMLLELLEHVVELSRGEPILILCAARPELLENRAGWGAGKLNAGSVLLEPLRTDAAGLLLARLGAGLDERTQAHIVSASGGNPLFLEQMASLALESSTSTVPSTIQALLTARLERLTLEERELLERGAVEGEVFHRKSVGALVDERLATELEPRLAALVRKELIRPHPAMFPGDEAFRFAHLLIRDAAYDGLPKATRAELHARFAGWLEQNATALAELDEIAGWHLEQAVKYGRELRREVDRSLVERAVEHLYAAGLRAGQRSDSGAARNLLDRALALAEDGQPVRAVIALELAEQMIHVADRDRLDELLSIGESEPELAGIAALVRFEWAIRARPQEAVTEVESVLPALLEEFQRAGNDRGLARAHMALLRTEWIRCRTTRASEEAALAAEHARRAGDEGMRERALAFGLNTLCLGPRSTPEIAVELESLEGDATGAFVTALLIYSRGELADLEGRFDEAERLARLAADALQEMGLTTLVGASHELLARIRRRSGDARGALAFLTDGDRILADLDEHSYRSTMQATLADVHEELGDHASARAALELSRRLGAPEEAANHVIADRVRAGLALADGDREGAARWARSALEQADRTDAFWLRGTARLMHARVLCETGRTAEASDELQAALAIYRAKGDRPATNQVEALIAALRV